jgi:predicted metalloprotease with PDZ domain
VINVLLVTLALSGQVSNQQGLIGVQIAKDGGIIRVHEISPAYSYGLQKGDKILSADGKKGINNVTGDAGTTAHLIVQKKSSGAIVEYNIPRVPCWEISKDTCAGVVDGDNVYVPEVGQ